MVSWWKRALSTGAVIGSLLGPAPSVKADTPHSSLESKIEEVSPENTRVETFYLDSDQEKSEPGIYFQWNYFTLKPLLLTPPKNSILSLVDSEDIDVSSLGVSLDFFVKRQDFTAPWQGQLSLGLFFDFSSTRMYHNTLVNKGVVYYEGIRAGYDLKGEMTYFDFGLLLQPSLMYSVGPLKVGLSFELKAGTAFISNENKIDISLKDEAIIDFVKGLGLRPDSHGSVQVYGGGGFAQMLLGPAVEWKGITCFAGIGIRYDYLELSILEKIDNPEIQKIHKGNYNDEYSSLTLTYGAKCGYRF